jgi:hypothetical protein
MRVKGATGRLRVKNRRKTMSAVAAAFAESGHGGWAGPPMTLGNMRANGVRSLAGGNAIMKRC